MIYQGGKTTHPKGSKSKSLKTRLFVYPDAPFKTKVMMHLEYIQMLHKYQARFVGFFLLFRTFTFHYLAHLCSQKYFTEYQLKEETISSVKDGTVSARTYTPFVSMLILYFEFSSSFLFICTHIFAFLPSSMMKMFIQLSVI